MNKFIKNILQDKGDVSSSRLINLLGAIVGSVLLLYHGLWLNSLSYDTLGVFLGYCGGVYAAGKYVSRKYSSEGREYDDVGYEGTERYKDGGYSGTGYDNSESSGNAHDYRG